MDNMGARDNYMIALHSAVSSRDSLNLAVLFNLKQAIGGYGQQDVDIKLEKGAVHVDLSDRLLFNGDSSSYAGQRQSKTVLGRTPQRPCNDPARGRIQRTKAAAIHCSNPATVSSTIGTSAPNALRPSFGSCKMTACPRPG